MSGKRKSEELKSVAVTGELRDVATGSVRPGRNPRGRIDTQSRKYRDLLASVESSGIQVPLAVMECGAGFELLAGARRLAAAQELELPLVPAIVYSGLTEEEKAEVTFAENFGREDLTLIEETRAAEMLMEMHDGDAEACASRMGLTDREFRRRLHLLKLSPAWQEALASEGRRERWLSPAHLELIANLDEEQQDEALTAGFCFAFNGSPLSVANLREQIMDEQRALEDAPWPLDDEGFEGCAACEKCVQRSDATGQLGLWEDEDGGGDPVAVCLNAECWNKKSSIWLEAAKKTAEEKHGPDLMLVTTDYCGDEDEGVTPDYRLEDVLKKDDGARPALMIDGPKAGKIKWVKPHSMISSQKEREAAEKAPATLEEKREGLRRRRWFLVIERLVEILKKKTWEDVKPELTSAGEVEYLTRLVCAFGTFHKREYCNAEDWEIFYAGEITEDMRSRLWLEVRYVLYERLKYAGPKGQTPDEHIQEAGKIAKLIGEDIAAMFEAATEDVPEPKAWAEMEDED